MPFLHSKYYKRSPSNNGKLSIEELENSIYILQHIWKDCEEILETLNSQASRTPVPGNLVTKLGKYISIRVAAFFDEIWNHTQCLLEEFNDHDLLMIIQVVLSEYEGLFDDNHRVRNWVYAHNLRDKKNDYDWIFNDVQRFKIPTQPSEFAVLVNLMRMICTSIHKKHPDALSNASGRIKEPTFLDTGITKENYLNIFDQIRKKAENALQRSSKN